MKSLSPYTYFDYPTRTYVEIYSPANPQPMALYPLTSNVTNAESLAANRYYVNTSENAITFSGTDITEVTLDVADIMYLKSGTPVVAEIVGNLKGSSNASSGNGGSAVEVLFEAKTDSELGVKGTWTQGNVTTGSYIIKLSYNWLANTYTTVISSPIVISDLDLTRVTRFNVPVNLNYENYIIIGYVGFTLENGVLSYNVSSGIDAKIANNSTINTNSVNLTVAGFYKIN